MRLAVDFNGGAFRRARLNESPVRRIVFNGVPVWSEPPAGNQLIVVGAGAGYAGELVFVRQPNGGEAACSGNAGYWTGDVHSRESAAANSDAAVFTAEKLPVSQYGRLTVTWEHYAQDEYATHGASHFGLADSTQIRYENGYPTGGFLKGKFVSKTGTDSGWSTDEIDLSDVHGDCYLGLVVSSGASGLESFRAAATVTLAVLSDGALSE